MTKLLSQRQHRVLWWGSSLSGPILFSGIAIWSATMGNWGLTFTSALFTCISLLWVSTNVQTFYRGYLRGMSDVAEASQRAESQDEFNRLILSTPLPKPWQ
jgi:hypothetical protein